MIFFIENYLKGFEKMMHELVDKTIIEVFSLAVLIVSILFMYLYCIFKLYKKINI
jgi:hypothetical protein